MSATLPPEPPTIGPDPAMQPAPLMVLAEPGEEAADAAASREEDGNASSVGGALRLLVASGPGRGGIVLFAIMLAISVWVALTYPLDFGTAVWSNPAVWADNPKGAPPVWSNALTGGHAVPHTIVTRDAPTSVSEISVGQVRQYDFPLAYGGGDAPTGLSLTLTGVTFSGRPPAVLVTLLRPDGGEIRLAGEAIAGPRPDETSPYRRFYDVHDRILLADDPAVAGAVAQWYGQHYPNAPAPPDLSGNVEAALFGRPAPNGPGAIEPLPGDYAVRVQAVVADKADAFAPMTVVMGGTVYGVMGTDGLGRDIWQGLLYGFPIGLLIATLAALLSTVIGASLGILSGYAGGALDTVIQRASDIVSNVPVLPLLIFLVSVLGRHLWLIILILVAFSWPGLTILVRSMVLQLRSGQLVEAARALGASRGRIMRRHIFPQVAPFIVAQMIFFAPGAILAEASLSFLGLGDPSIPTWGQMLEAGFSTGALYIGYWWWILPPGILIVLTALAFTLLALALEPIVDPRLRQP
ncbi:MAG TPA: ABC transporter permease [Thermomicrobiales bacterium]|nr:ABC transporter permease [Thermomicrobiales bacterium]